MTKLIVFDLDGTIVVEPEFYKEVYSGTLTDLVEDVRGERGLETLRFYRENYDGKGELALFALNIPFRMWAERLINASLDLISPQPELVEKFRSLKSKKVIYTGSPVEMADKILQRVGFTKDDVDLIVGWREPELSPLKWSCSPLVFESILLRFQHVPADAWAVGDDWDTDLNPAKVIGMRTARVRKQGGFAAREFGTLVAFLDHILGGERHE